MIGLSRVISIAERMVSPTPKEEGNVKNLANFLLTSTRKAALNYPETRGVLLGGSFAKGTWLPRHVDLDLFVKFDPTISDSTFERIGLEVGEIVTRGHPTGKKYAQHPYTEATVGGIRVNIVPCFDVEKGKWRSAADRSPYHVSMVEKLPTGVKTQIRLLKKFMNSVGVYGAEIQTRGFSGYVAEVLVMNHGSLEKVLHWFADYKLRDANSLFSLPDPVDEKRDLGVAVSGESLGKMVTASREFLSRPRQTFFRKMAGRTHPRLRRDVVAVVFSHRPLSEDTLWGELRRTCKHIVRHLEVQGFMIARSMAASDNKTNSAFLFIPEFADLPKVVQRIGPTVDRRKDVEAFVSSNARDSQLVWVDDDARVRLLKPRPHTRLVDLLEDIVKERSGPIGGSTEIQAGMRRTASVKQGDSLARSSKAGWLRDGLREITTDAVGTGRTR